MKALRLFIISLLVITNATFAQSNTTSEKPASDFLMIQLGVDGWAGKPDSLRTTGIWRALNIYVCKNYPLKNSKLSFAIGAGIGSSNVFLDNQEVRFSDTSFVITTLTTNTSKNIKTTTPIFIKSLVKDKYFITYKQPYISILESFPLR